MGIFDNHAAMHNFKRANGFNEASPNCVSEYILEIKVKRHLKEAILNEQDLERKNLLSLISDYNLVFEMDKAQLIRAIERKQHHGIDSFATNLIYRFGKKALKLEKQDKKGRNK